VLDLYTLMAIRMAHVLVLPLEFQNTVDWSASYLKSEKMTVPSEAKNIQTDLDALAMLRPAVAANATPPR